MLLRLCHLCYILFKSPTFSERCCKFKNQDVEQEATEETENSVSSLLPLLPPV